MSDNRSHNRYLRHGRFARVRHRKHLLNFLATQGTRLTASATGETPTILTVGGGVAAIAVLTGSANFTAADTVTVGSKTYTFQSSLTNVDGNVKLDASVLANTLANLAAAINLTAGAGTTYAAATTANAAGTSAVATATTVTITLTTPGTAGNAIASTSSIASSHGSFGHVTFTGGLAVSSGGSKFTATGHGYHEAEGPFLLTSSGTDPAGIAVTELVWVHVVDANTIQLAPKHDNIVKAEYITATSAGTGTFTLTRATTSEGMYELLKHNKSDTILKATDIDNLV